MPILKTPLLWLGLALLAVFALTGQYLQHAVKPVLGDDLAHRAAALYGCILALAGGLLPAAKALDHSHGHPPFKG